MAIPAKNMPDLTESRAAILRWLATYKYGLNSQISRYVLPDKSETHTNDEMAWLVEAGCVAASTLQKPDKRGGRPPKCYRLTAKGAKAIGVPFGSQYDRIPEWAQIVYLDRVLAFRAHCEAVAAPTGWTLTRPFPYNSEHPRPEQTPQYMALATALTARAYQSLYTYDVLALSAAEWADMRADFSGGGYCACVPAQANDYVLSRLTPKVQAAVFILPQADASENFWKERVGMYGALVEYVPVFAVYASEAEAQPWLPTLKAGGLRATLVANMPTVIRAIERYAGS